MTTKSDIRRWLAKAPDGTAFVIVACDKFDHSDFPVYASTPEIASEHLERFSGDGMNHTSVMEVYDLSLDIESQLAETRAYHPPKSVPKSE